MHIVKGGELSDGLWWVDDTGRWNAVDSIGTGPLGSNPIGTTLEHQQIAYRHLGMAMVRVHADTCEIAWDVKHVEMGTFSALTDFLGRQPSVSRIRLSFYFGAWQREIWRGSRPAWKRMLETTAFRDATPFHGATIRNVTVDDIPATSRPILDVYQAWERSGGRPGRPGADTMAAVHPQLLVFRPQGKDGRLHFSEIGAKSALARFLGREWAKTAVGKRYDRGQSDYDYEDRVTGGYAQAMETGEPRFDQIRAVLRPEDGEPVWVSYQRLLVRSFDADGTPRLSCFSYPTQDISIPVPAALPDR